MAHGINPNQLARWRRELNQAPRARPHLVEVRPLPADAATPAAGTTGAVTPGIIEFDCRGGHLRVTGDANPDLVRLILAALTLR
jgi:hypothetical protein